MVQRKSSGEKAEPASLAEAIGVCRNGFVVVAVFSLFVNLLMLTTPIFMLQIFTRVLTARSSDTLVVLLVMAIVALLALALLDAIRGMALIRIGTWLDRRLSGPVLEASLAAGLARSDGAGSTQGLRDLSTVRSFLSGPSIFPVLDAPWAPLFVAVMFLLHPVIGWIAVVGALVLFGFALLNEFATRELLMASGGASVRSYRQADATVRNADVIAAMGMANDLIDRWHRNNASALAMQAKASDRSAAISAAAKFLRFVLQIGVLSAGAWLVLQNLIDPGAMIAASILMGRALQPIDQSITAWKAGVSARVAYRRLADLLDRHRPTAPSMKLPVPAGRIAVEAATFAHALTGDPAIRGVSFELAPGEAMGLVGPTAAGKTTLARLLVGNLVPRAGHVRLDGMEISAWDPAGRGRHVGYLPQDVELFDGTIKENIARMGAADPDGVVEAARLAGVHEMIMRMPQGYDTPIGEGGAALSGGQRQRIALARAVYGNPRLIVLDEPGASLDSDGEHALVAALNALKENGATVITIAHRPSMLRTVDKILVLYDGRVQSFGPRAEIMASLTGAEVPEIRPAGLEWPNVDQDPKEQRS